MGDRDQEEGGSEGLEDPGEGERPVPVACSL